MTPCNHFKFAMNVMDMMDVAYMTDVAYITAVAYMTDVAYITDVAYMTEKNPKTHCLNTLAMHKKISMLSQSKFFSLTSIKSQWCSG